MRHVSITGSNKINLFRFRDAAEEEKPFKIPTDMIQHVKMPSDLAQQVKISASLAQHGRLPAGKNDLMYS